MNEPAALSRCFGSEKVQDLRPLDGGWSAAANFYLKHDGRELVLRQLKSSPQQRLRELQCTKLAGVLEIGPRVVRHAEDGEWLLIEFCPGRTLRPSDLASPTIRENLVKVMRRLHQFTEDLPEAEPLYSRLQRVGSGAEHLFEGLGVSPPPVLNSGLIHSDFHFDNLMLTSDTELKVIDWANAGLGDPCVDLAQLAILTDPGDDRLVQTAYWGEGSNPDRLTGYKRVHLAIILSDHRNRAGKLPGYSVSDFDTDVLSRKDSAPLAAVAQKVFSGELNLDSPEAFVDIGAAALSDLRRHT